MPYDPEPFYAHITERIPLWAAARADLRAVVQVGSRARRDHLADRYSDADYILVVPDQAPYLADTAWTADFGEVVNLLHAKTSGGDDELLVMYAGGYTVDYVFTPADRLQYAIDHQMPILILQRGARILVDKDGQAGRLMALQQQPISPPPPLPAEEFLGQVRGFWYAAVYLAKQIKRGDLLMLMIRDSDLKRNLIGFIEIHARAVYGPQHDTWHMGRYIEEWADPRAVLALPAVFPPYDAPGAWLSLRASMDLFAWLARESAAKLGYSYPAAVETSAYQALDSLEKEGN
jgi:aminoglycoside 6-adenylyltransferase